MRRREFLATAAAPLLAQPNANTVEQWGMFEVSFNGHSNGNPFTDVTLNVTFRQPGAEYRVSGFYDGRGVYKARFMPPTQGDWSYQSESNTPQLSGKTGRFTSTAPSPGNHGPVRVNAKYHFAYADQTRYIPIGTTCYAWTHQGDELEQQTLATLAKAPFNKMRMCVFPKSYTFNQNEPVYYPFERDASGNSDFTRLVPAFFAHLERRILDLQKLGIEADLILFHPYDRWGYASMGAANDDRYLRYAIARVSAFRNVWWSVANEWNYVKSKRMDDWDRFCRIISDDDPYHHLVGIHNGGSEADVMYDHSKSWITHVSIQSRFLETGRALREQYGKPVVFDECYYEGNISQRWGDISGEEMVRRFWMGTANGAYVGHGETYQDPNDIIWWSKGGKLKGESPARIAFLRKILEDSPAPGLTAYNSYYPSAGVEGQYYLHFLDIHRPNQTTLELPKTGRFQIDVIDPWAMTITPQPKTFEGKAVVSLPGKPYLALRVKRVDL